MCIRDRDEVMPYVRDRKQFGQAIGSFQLMQGKIADMYTTFNVCRAVSYTHLDVYKRQRPR